VVPYSLPESESESDWIGGGGGELIFGDAGSNSLFESFAHTNPL